MKNLKTPFNPLEVWKHNEGNIVHAKSHWGWQVTADNGETWRFCNSPFETYYDFDTMAKKMPNEKMDRDSKEYRKKAIALALSFAPTIHPCRDCGHPVASGYCCPNDECGSVNP